ncbi:MAG: hypothetical protein ABI162_07080 [Luteolibacter sp.]
MSPEAIIALLTALEPLAADVLAFWLAAKDHLAQSDELSPELEAALDARIEMIKVNPEEYQKQQPL